MPTTAIVKPALWNVQQGLVHPKWDFFYRGLVANYPMWDGILPRDYVGNFHMETNEGNNVSFGANVAGVGVSGSGTTARIEDADAGNMDGLANGTELNITWYGRFLSDVVAGICSLHSEVGGEAGVFSLRVTNTDIRFDIPWVASIFTTSYTRILNRDQLWTLSRRGDDYRVWADGVEVASATSSSAFNTTEAHRFGLFDTISIGGSHVHYYYMVIGKRGWSKAEHDLLLEDPFGPYTLDDDIFGRVAAVGGATPKGPLGHPFHGPFAGPVN